MRSFILRITFLGIFASFMPVFALPAHAACDASEAETKSCVAQDLRDSDKRINAVYQALMAAIDAPAQSNLKDAQRAWLKLRDKTCNLNNKEYDREKWLQAILADDAKMLCVVRFTFSRVRELDEMLKGVAPNIASASKLPEAPSAPALPATKAIAEMPSDLIPFDDGFGVATWYARKAGRWYYEILIDRAGVARQGDVLLMAGLIGKEGGISWKTNVRRTETGASPLSLGVAIDLEQGFAYFRFNGTWGQTPGTTAGAMVKLNRDWRMMIQGSTEIEALIKAGLIKVNLGDRPFEYALPDGYRPFKDK